MSFAAKSRARILKPGELTLAIYGADEAIKWEKRVMDFTRKCRFTYSPHSLPQGSPMK